MKFWFTVATAYLLIIVVGLMIGVQLSRFRRRGPGSGGSTPTPAPPLPTEPGLAWTEDDVRALADMGIELSRT